MIGERIKQARIALGLSLRAVAEQLAVSPTAIQKYEDGKLQPSSGVLLKLAQVYGVRVEYFFRTDTVTLEHVEYRKQSSVPKKTIKRIQADAREQLEREFALNRILPSSLPPFTPPADLPDCIDHFDQIEAVAEQVRAAWKLGENPIPDLIDTLEAQGIAVLLTRAHGNAKFDGLAARANGHPVVVVGADWPGDRQRFTLAHELGHLLLAGRLAGTLDEEHACHRFAGAFLAPASAVRAALGNQRRRLETQELCLLKEEYGLSMYALLYRARDLGILRETEFKHWAVEFSKRGWRQTEPGEPYPAEQPRRFRRSVYRALAEDLISESKAAELVGKPLLDFHAERCTDVADAAATH